MPAAAVYFRDPDGHLLEYLAMLDEDADPERGITTWSAWNANRTRRDTSKGSVVGRIRDALPDEAAALEALQRRSSDVWEEYRAQLAANPDAIEAPIRRSQKGASAWPWTQTSSAWASRSYNRCRAGRCELDDLFVEPESMGLGVGRLLVDDVASRAEAAGAAFVDVIANPNALGFYERVGFEITGDASTRFGRGVRMSFDRSRHRAR